MTRVEQTATLAEKVAHGMRYRSYHQLAYLDQEVYGTLLHRRSFHPSSRHNAVTMQDVTILHQVQYILENVSPADLERQARELRQATLNG